MRFSSISLALTLMLLALITQLVSGASTTVDTGLSSTFTLTSFGRAVTKVPSNDADMLIMNDKSIVNMLIIEHTSYLCSMISTPTPSSPSTSTPATWTATVISMPKRTSTNDLKNVTIQLPAEVAFVLKQLKLSELFSVIDLFIDAYTLIWWSYRIVVGTAIAVVGLLLLWTSWLGRQAWQARQVAL